MPEVAYVRRIDFAEELAAEARGECLACRIGARHKADSECPRAREWSDWWCSRGGHDFPKKVRGGSLVVSGPCLACGKRG